MNDFDLTPRAPTRPMFWPDVVLDLQDLLHDHEHAVYIVGGAVRDAYLHRPVKDIDLVTSQDAVKLARKIANHFKGDVFVMDAERDVARALINTPEGRLNIDVAGYRGPDLLADLRDRDFTVNAMVVDLKAAPGMLIDPLNGERDLKERVIRRCGPQSIAQDVVRMLRAIRQSAQLDARLEPQTLVDIRAHVDDLFETSPERIRDEFFRLLGASRPGRPLRAADALGLLPVIIPELRLLRNVQVGVVSAYDYTMTTVDKLHNIMLTISPRRTDTTAATFEMGMIVVGMDRYRRRLQDHLAAHWPNDRPHTSLLILAALTHATGMTLSAGRDYPTYSAQFAQSLGMALRLSNHEIERLTLAVEHHRHPALMPENPYTPLMAHRYWYRLGEAGVDAALLSLAHYLATVANNFTQDPWLLQIERVQVLLNDYYEQHAQIVAPPVLINGAELQKALNIKAGPIIGELLVLIREGQVTGDITTADEAIAAAQRHLDTQAD